MPMLSSPCWGPLWNLNKSLNVTERVTLITGASAGIGTELARMFASNGHRVALVARRADRLKALADELGGKGCAVPIVIPCDLQQPDAGDRIEQALREAGVEVEYLVNNAGFGVFGLAVARDRAEQLNIITVNIRALTDLTLRFADQLIRNRGGILNLGSIAGFLPGPGMAVYYASKAYVLSFSEALRCELAPQGVRVTVVCPGPVPSEFQDRAGFAPGFDSAILNVAAAEVARQAYRGLMANKRAVMPGFFIKMVPFLLRFFPRSFILTAVGGFQLRKR
ncbi:Sulfoacetaldehyde reductase [Bradyrhizobium ivorense]|uniref:Sulfoacetaldehyde reductase n=1 Tax=Bradyrhizobium ivorense TaxID=2511166 RepID=A0A508SS06_9BRAD|nr:Sulfoacetaldehyde reductase [Bradyrhizobium ivorense]VIO66854.1 Sulfoacetaldehyde reductase [Bradyrhizobium ivorense]